MATAKATLPRIGRSMARILLLLLACLSLANAASFTTASCAIGSITQMASGPTTSFCGIPAGTPDVEADARVSETFTPFLAEIRTSSGAQAASVRFPPLTEFLASSAANTGDIAIDTPGPVRQGLISFTIGISNVHSGFASAVITEGTRQYSLQSTPGGCQLHSCVDTAVMPILLGTRINVVSESDVSLFGTFAFNQDGGGGSAGTTFSLFEADGVTPVEMFVVPEPCSVEFLLVGSGLFFVHVMAKRRSRHRHQPSFAISGCGTCR